MYHDASQLLTGSILVFRGSLTLASQSEGPTAAQQAFTANHKAACQHDMSQQTIACTRCKHHFRLGQKGGCAYHPGAMDFTCKNEGRPDERNIFDRYDCCQRTVLDTRGMLLLLHCTVHLPYCMRRRAGIGFMDSVVMDALCCQCKISILIDATCSCCAFRLLIQTAELGDPLQACSSAHVVHTLLCMFCATCIARLLLCMQTGVMYTLQCPAKSSAKSVFNISMSSAGCYRNAALHVSNKCSCTASSCPFYFHRFCRLQA